MFWKARNHCPGVVGGRLDESGGDGILADILDRGGEVFVALDDPRGEAPAPEVAVAAVAQVEPLGIAAVQVLHPTRETRLRRLDEQVVVRAHQANGDHAPSVAIDAFLE
jgi:hypothetical protein